MARTGYLGGSIIRPGDPRPTQVGPVTVSNIPRRTGLGSHAANIKQQAIRMDAATIIARLHGFVVPGMTVEPSAAEDQNFGATGGQHAAHAVKRYTFGGKSIVEIYSRPGVDEMAVIALKTMLGLVTDVDRRANLSIDKRLETNPQRVAQLQSIVNGSVANLAEARKLAHDLELNRRMFELALLQSMHGGFGGDASYAAMLSTYEATLAAPPPWDETPARAVDMIASMVGD